VSLGGVSIARKISYGQKGYGLAERIGTVHVMYMCHRQGLILPGREETVTKSICAFGRCVNCQERVCKLSGKCVYCQECPGLWTLSIKVSSSDQLSEEAGTITKVCTLSGKFWLVRNSQNVRKDAMKAF
jgi:hypothetical protein